MGTGSTTRRWGDYSTTSVDPDDPTIFWTIQMYPSSSSAWSTQITQILTNPTPVPLTIARAGTNVRVCWSNTVARFQLQSTLALSANSTWSSVSPAPTTNGNLLCVLTPDSGAQRFFRLILPP